MRAGLVDYPSYKLVPRRKLRAKTDTQQKDCKAMAVTLSPTPSFRAVNDAHRVHGRRTLDTPPEPVLGRIQTLPGGGDCHGINARVYQRPQRTWQNEMRGETERPTGLTSRRRPECRGFANAAGSTSWVWHGRRGLDAKTVCGGALTLHARGLSPWHGTSLTWNGRAGC